MLAAGGGAIVNTASTAGKKAVPLLASYAAAKARLVRAAQNNDTFALHLHASLLIGGVARSQEEDVATMVAAATAQWGRSFTVRTVIANRNDAYRPGMSFRANFAAPGRKRPAVPESAVVWGSDLSYLWAVRGGVARRVPMTITARRDGMVLFSGALRPNDRIIVEGVQKVREGQRVELVAPAAPDAQRATVRPARADP